MIKIDTREKENSHIKMYFFKNFIDYDDRQSLKTGDYENTENPEIVIERKANLVEFSGNCGKQHDRFKRELERLKESGKKMYILIEQPITYENLPNWKNPRGQMNGDVIKKICDKWKQEYNIEIVFCKKEESGKKIVELLGGENEL